jgi:uncharacterized protein
MTPSSEPWRIGGPGLLVRVRLTPKAARDAVVGIAPTSEGPALQARVRAVPENGAANEALARLLAAWLGVPPTTVVLASGGKSRVKTLAVAGDGTMLAERARRLAGP